MNIFSPILNQYFVCYRPVKHGFRNVTLSSTGAQKGGRNFAKRFAHVFKIKTRKNGTQNMIKSYFLMVVMK